jgi:hypothetical protein
MLLSTESSVAEIISSLERSKPDVVRLVEIFIIGGAEYDIS